MNIMPLCVDNMSKGLATIRFLDDVKSGLMLICNTLKQVKRWVILCLFYEYLLQHSRLTGVPYKFMSVCQFVRPSVLSWLIFLRIGSIVFSNILHEVWKHNGWKMMEPDVSKKSGFPVFFGETGSKWPTNAVFGLYLTIVTLLLAMDYLYVYK